jgi:hypothetical protein
MRHPLSRRLVIAAAILAVAFVLAASPSTVQAAGPAAAHASLGTADLAAALRSWLGMFWPTEGCTADPSGNQHCGSNSVVHPPPPQHAQPVRPAEGCNADPDGSKQCSPG